MHKNNHGTLSYGWRFMALILLVPLLWTGGEAMGQNAPPRSDNDTRRWQIADMDSFLDSHPEISEQLQKDPSLIKNDEFVEKHPALQEYLQQHPGIREEFTENPNAFMRRERQFERQEDVGRGDRDDRRWGDNDTTRAELANMDRFLDGHPEISEQLQKDPSLINNKEFVEKHPALQEFLQTHPGVREEFRENPSAFMRQEQRFERHEGDRDDRGEFGDHDTTRAELATMDRFLDKHPEIEEQLRKDPSLIRDREFVQNHPELQEFLQNHPEVREEFRENPSAFMRQERRFERHEGDRNPESGVPDRDRDHDGDRREMASFGQFLGGHTGVAEELSKNPSLANNQDFLESHPDLSDYLKDHPEMKQELAKDPQAVMTTAKPAGSGTTATPKLEPKHKQ